MGKREGGNPVHAGTASQMLTLACAPRWRAVSMGKRKLREREVRAMELIMSTEASRRAAGRRAHGYAE